MPSYIELNSFFDEIPFEFDEKLLNNKFDVLCSIDSTITKINMYASHDGYHSAKYYFLY